MSRTVYLQPATDGQTFALDMNGNRVDSFRGPPDMLMRYYLRCGSRVVVRDTRFVKTVDAAIGVR